jgi:hypothetical protein
LRLGKFDDLSHDDNFCVATLQETNHERKLKETGLLNESDQERNSWCGGGTCEIVWKERQQVRDYGLSSSIGAVTR